MRDFFKSELETLYAKTQLRQYETLSAMVDADGNQDGKRQIRVMIDSCVQACASFPEIPDSLKQQFILKAMIEDGDFKGFSAPWVWKVLNSKRDTFVRTQAHYVESDPKLKPVSFDELPANLKAEVEALKRKLSDSGAGLKVVPAVTQAEIDAIKREDEISQEGQKSAAIEYRQKSAEIYTRKMEVIKARGLDKVDLRDLKMFMIEDQTIHARNREEAEEIWLEIYGG